MRYLDEPSKLSLLLTSRKFWAAVLGLAAVLVVHFTGRQIPVDTLVEAIMAIVGLYIGGTALEDGLARR